MPSSSAAAATIASGADERRDLGSRRSSYCRCSVVRCLLELVELERRCTANTWNATSSEHRRGRDARRRTSEPSGAGGAGARDAARCATRTRTCAACRHACVGRSRRSRRAAIRQRHACARSVPAASCADRGVTASMRSRSAARPRADGRSRPAGWRPPRLHVGRSGRRVSRRARARVARAVPGFASFGTRVADLCRPTPRTSPSPCGPRASGTRARARGLRADEVHRVVEPVGEVRQLAVDLHADRLEGAARGVRRRGGAPARGSRRWIDVDELARSCERPGRDDRRARCGGRTAPRRCARSRSRERRPRRSRSRRRPR